MTAGQASKPKFKMPLQANDWGGQPAIEDQRRRAVAIAEAILRGERIEPEDRSLVAHALIRWAASLPTKIKRPRGRPPAYDIPKAAQHFVALRHQGWLHRNALLETAMVFGVDADDEDTLQKKMWDKLKPYVDKGR